MKIPLARAAFVALLTVLLAPSTVAQLQSPTAFLGYELGERFTPHHRVVSYVQHVGDHSPNVEVSEYGQTYEGRPLLLALIASPKNLARMNEIRESNLSMAGITQGLALDDAPAIVWLSYNVHGNESVSTEAALQTLYELADSNNARTQAWLENTVVILDPCINPDGRDRYVGWYNRTVGRYPSPNPDDWTHREPWPGGRTNHYYFDLNRDWSWATQLETQRRLEVYNRWMPHVHVDFHEQGINQPYFFAPAAEPFHESVTTWQREFQTTIGQNNAKYFDANNWLYFTKESFDLLYPGYGDTWPTFNGAIGMTYEQAGGGRAGLGIVTAEADTLTLKDRIAHHHTTGLSTIEVTSKHATRVVQEFASFFGASQSSPAGRFRSYVVRADGREDAVRTLATLLEHQGIRIGFAGSAASVKGFLYASSSEGSFAVAPGDLVISASQPKSTLLKVLFDPETVLVDSLTYDITAWALPYLYNLDAVASTQAVDASGAEPWRVTPPPQSDKPYAYLAESRSFEDQRFLAALLTNGVSVRVATRPFTIDDDEFARGTLIVTRTGNDALGDAFDDTIASLSREMGQPIRPVLTGLVADGPDFGSSAVAFLKRPTVAVVGGPETSSSSLGSVWHYFDQQLGYPVNILEASSLGAVKMSKYDVIVLPSGSYTRPIDDRVLDKLKEWIRGGGRLIAIGRGTSFLAGKSGFDLKTKDVPTDTSSYQPIDDAYGERRRSAVSRSIAGAIFTARIDATHPLAYGFGRSMPILRQSSTAYELLKGRSNWNVGVVEDGTPISGFAGFETRTNMDGSLAAGVQRMGSGTVVYLADDPLFRGLWHAGKQLFGNAVFFVGLD